MTRDTPTEVHADHADTLGAAIIGIGEAVQSDEHVAQTMAAGLAMLRRHLAPVLGPPGGPESGDDDAAELQGAVLDAKSAADVLCFIAEQLLSARQPIIQLGPAEKQALLHMAFDLKAKVLSIEPKSGSCRW